MLLYHNKIENASRSAKFFLRSFCVQGNKEVKSVWISGIDCGAAIPDVHCNGDMHDALEYAGRIKHEQKDFLTEQGIESIYKEGDMKRKIKTFLFAYPSFSFS